LRPQEARSTEGEAMNAWDSYLDELADLERTWVMVPPSQPETPPRAMVAADIYIMDIYYDPKN
jgi:hypothetical protein